MTVRGNLPKFYLVPIQIPTDVELRSKQIKTRLHRLESAHNNLAWDQKWPTKKSMERHAYNQARQIPQIVIHPPTPDHEETPWTYSNSSYPTSPSRPSPDTLRQLLAPPAMPRAEFPIPISKSASQLEKVESPTFMESSFIYFQFLPAELRLQIWDIELHRPKIIEAQFSTQFEAPAFVGGCTRGSPLLYVCRESREQALSLYYEFLTPVQRDLGNRWSQTPFQQPPSTPTEKSLPFIPATDTIFLRSLSPNTSSAQHSLTHSISNFASIQHLAIPLSSHLSLSPFKKVLSSLSNLKTLTFMLGGRDQSWASGGWKEIELRDVEEWFVDGRSREVVVEGWRLDVSEVGRFFGGACWEARMNGGDKGVGWKGVSVRCVAWRKEC